MMKKNFRHCFLPWLLVVAGCLQPAVSDIPAVSLSGRWQYTAVETGVTGGTILGVLTIEQSSSASFEGSLEGSSKSAATGETRTFAATISGSAPARGAIDFDVLAESEPRRHVGQIEAGVLSGTWLRLSGAGISASGTFSMRRIP